MRKSITLVILGLMVIAMLGAVSATGDKTAIAGKIYNADFTGIVAGATVQVTCNSITVPDVFSKVDGTYSVEYAGEDCNEGDVLSVHAFKSGVGENTITGNIYDDYPIEELNLNLGVVNVPLVPEFGLIAGMITVLGAVGVFFFVRKK